MFDQVDSELLRLHFFYTAILILKALCLAYLTGIFRIYYRVPITSEDLNYVGTSTKPDERIERIRRAHLNDLENIPFFIISSFIYITTGPEISTAYLVFRLYTFFRITHSVFYVYFHSTVGRVASFEISNVIMLYVVAKCIWNFI